MKKKANLNKFKTYEKFSKRVISSKYKLLKILKK